MVALTILSLVMGTAMVVFIRVSGSSLSFDKIRAGFLVRNAMEETRKSALYTSGEEEVGQIRLVRSVTPYAGDSRIMHVQISAIGPDERILSTTQALFSEHD